ncbi:MAG: hypothetical protein J5J06_11650 [Phycisphaerae bacterium]|nr:hypothetical protein [Phycisphaerae bacterium]
MKPLGHKSELSEADEGSVVDAGLRCEKCKYNLTGLEDNRCPECGTKFEVGPGGVLPTYRSRPLPIILMTFAAVCQLKIVAGMAIPGVMLVVKGISVFDFDGDGTPMELVVVGGALILPLALLSGLASTVGMFATPKSWQFKPLLLVSVLEVGIGVLGVVSRG